MNIVQIGAFSGYDDAYNYILQNSSLIDRVILVEPVSKFNTTLKIQYSFVKNLYIENIAIVSSDNLGAVDFFIAPNDGEVSSVNMQHIINHKYDPSEVKKFSVKCLTANKLFSKYNLTKIDKLFVDAEGLDADIIKSIDFKKYTIPIIEYENLHIDNYDLELFLSNTGYRIEKSVGLNGWSNRAYI